MTPHPENEDGQFTVLMTACIEPKVGVRNLLKRSQQGLRLRDYIDGLSFWLKLADPHIGGIVFAENSNYPLLELEQFAARLARPDRPVEFLSFDFPPPAEGFSYGHTEFLLVNRALEQSRLLCQRRYFIKATGRYIFPDVSRLLRRLPPDFLVAADSKGLRPFGLRANPITCVALIAFDREFYDSDLSCLPATMVPAPPWDRRQFIEPVLFDALYPRRMDPRIILRWPCNCDPVGVGSNGDDYRSFRKILQSGARAFSRRLCPGLWV
jgi:hypothetical protein